MNSGGWRSALRIAGRVALGTAALVVLIIVYASGIEPRLLLEVREETAPINGLPRSLEGTRIALIADLQVGMWWANRDMIRRVVARIVEDRPDLVLIAGDFIYGPGADPADEIGSVLEDIRLLVESDLPVFAVLGNHDWAVPTDRSPPDTAAGLAVERALEEVGIEVLRNEARQVRLGSRGAATSELWVAGIDSHYADYDRPEAALGDVPPDAPRVVLMHHPDSFLGIAAGDAPFAVAGHTHGGQLRIPFTPEWSWLTFVREDEAHEDGWVEPSYGAPGNRLYVNRGIGFSLLPMRLNARPEITYFTLRRAPA